MSGAVNWETVTFIAGMIGAAIMLTVLILLWVWRVVEGLRSELHDYKLHVASTYVPVVNLQRFEGAMAAMSKDLNQLIGEVRSLRER